MMTEGGRLPHCWCQWSRYSLISGDVNDLTAEETYNLSVGRQLGSARLSV